MFPFQKGDLCFHFSNNNNDEQDVTNGTNYLANHSTSSSSHSRKNNCLEKSLTIGQDHNNISNVNQGNINGRNEDANKRMIHRETERQRRQEMTTLYSSLRSILPLEYIKGKRSMSDHICEAAKYIKDLERNVKELGNRRDNLKETCSLSNKMHGNVKCPSTTISSLSSDDCNVNIHAFSKAIEIEICLGVEQEDDPFPLSRVLKVLNEQGLDVISCVSSKLNKKWIYVIHCQAEDVASIDPTQLQWRLKSEIIS